MPIELGEIFFRKTDSKIFSVREILEIPCNVSGDDYFQIKYKLVSNDKEILILTLNEIKKKFN